MPSAVAVRFVLAVRDLRAATDYYMHVLGMQRDFGDESDGWSFLSRGAFRVMLGHCADERPASELGNHSYFAYVTLDDVDAFHGEITARGARPSAPPITKPWGMREFALETPEGHRLTFGTEVGRG